MLQELHPVCEETNPSECYACAECLLWPVHREVEPVIIGPVCCKRVAIKAFHSGHVQGIDLNKPLGTLTWPRR